MSPVGLGGVVSHGDQHHIGLLSGFPGKVWKLSGQTDVNAGIDGDALALRLSFQELKGKDGRLDPPWMAAKRAGAVKALARELRAAGFPHAKVRS